MMALSYQINVAAASAVVDKKRSCIDCGSKNVKKEAPIVKSKAKEPKPQPKAADSGLNFNTKLKSGNTTGYKQPSNLYKKKDNSVAMGVRG